MDAIGWPEESDPPLAARGTMLGNGAVDPPYHNAMDHSQQIFMW